MYMNTHIHICVYIPICVYEHVCIYEYVHPPVRGYVYIVYV